MTLTKKQLHKVLSDAGRKGGRAKTAKGFALISKEKHRELSSKGGSQERRK